MMVLLSGSNERTVARQRLLQASIDNIASVLASTKYPVQNKSDDDISNVSFTMAKVIHIKTILIRSDMYVTV